MLGLNFVLGKNTLGCSTSSPNKSSRTNKSIMVEGAELHRHHGPKSLEPRLKPKHGWEVQYPALSFPLVIYFKSKDPPKGHDSCTADALRTSLCLATAKHPTPDKPVHCQSVWPRTLGLQGVTHSANPQLLYCMSNSKQSLCPAADYRKDSIHGHWMNPLRSICPEIPSCFPINLLYPWTLTADNLPRTVSLCWAKVGASETIHLGGKKTEWPPWVKTASILTGFVFPTLQKAFQWASVAQTPRYPLLLCSWYSCLCIRNKWVTLQTTTQGEYVSLDRGIWQGTKQLLQA